MFIIFAVEETNHFRKMHEFDCGLEWIGKVMRILTRDVGLIVHHMLCAILMISISGLAWPIVLVGRHQFFITDVQVV